MSSSRGATGAGDAVATAVAGAVGDEVDVALTVVAGGAALADFARPLRKATTPTPPSTITPTSAAATTAASGVLRGGVFGETGAGSRLRAPPSRDHASGV